MKHHMNSEEEGGKPDNHSSSSSKRQRLDSLEKDSICFESSECVVENNNNSQCCQREKRSQQEGGSSPNQFVSNSISSDSSDLSEKGKTEEEEEEDPGLLLRRQVDALTKKNCDLSQQLQKSEAREKQLTKQLEQCHASLELMREQMQIVSEKPSPPTATTKQPQEDTAVATSSDNSAVCEFDVVTTAASEMTELSCSKDQHYNEWLEEIQELENKDEEKEICDGECPTNPDIETMSHHQHKKKLQEQGEPCHSDDKTYQSCGNAKLQKLDGVMQVRLLEQITNFREDVRKMVDKLTQQRKVHQSEHDSGDSTFDWLHDMLIKCQSILDEEGDETPESMQEDCSSPKTADLLNQVSVLSQANADLETVLESLTTESTAESRRLKELSTEKQALISKNQSLTKSNWKLSSENRNLSVQNHSLQQKNQSFSAKNKQLTERNKELSATVADFKAASDKKAKIQPAILPDSRAACEEEEAAAPQSLPDSKIIDHQKQEIDTLSKSLVLYRKQLTAAEEDNRNMALKLENQESSACPGGSPIENKESNLHFDGSFQKRLKRIESHVYETFGSTAWAVFQDMLEEDTSEQAPAPNPEVKPPFM